MINRHITQSLGIVGIAMGLMASPLAFSETFVSPSLHSDPVNDTRHVTQPAFSGHAAANNPTELSTLSPSFQSDPVRDPRRMAQPHRSAQGDQHAPLKLASPSMKSDPINGPFARHSC